MSLMMRKLTNGVLYMWQVCAIEQLSMSTAIAVGKSSRICCIFSRELTNQSPVTMSPA